MKKTFKLEGLDCANCAAKIENAVKKIDGVSSASRLNRQKENLSSWVTT